MMKKRVWLYVLGIMCFLLACKEVKTTDPNCEQQKAKMILWVDKAPGEKVTDWGHFKNVKVKAKVFSDGTFRILSWCKKQEPKVVVYLEKRVAAFQIDKYFFDEGYIEQGEQYLQLKYVPEKVNRK